MKKLTKTWAVLVAAFFVGLAQDQTQSFTIHVTGQKTWGVEIGFGDPTLLSLEGLSAGQLTLTQSLWAQIEGTVLDFLKVRASFNDQLGPGFQDFLVILDRKPWYAELGRFVVGGEGDALGVYNKRVLGAKVQVSREEIHLGVLLARLEGISESLVFRGASAHRELTFFFDDPDRPWLPAPYSVSVEGLFYFELRLPFIEGFSQPKLSFRTGPDFQKFLSDWGLDYLGETAEKNSSWALPSGAYVVVQDEGDVLLLRVDPKVLLRNRILDLIDLYNAAQGLSGASKKSYPFVLDSELEAAFLSHLSGFADLEVDRELYPLEKGGRRRYLNLGETGIQEESLQVEVRLPGETEFRALPDPALSTYSFRLFGEKGILRLDFPAEFFRNGAALRVNFDYRREGSTFSLGLSLIPGSERVYLNGQLLKKDRDYSIDYEGGILTLFVTLGPQDEIRVDFERQRGGLGVATEYERYFLGASLGLGPGSLGVWQATDVGKPSPTSRTMPNTHSLGVFSWKGSLGAWEYSLRLGFSQNVFPQDDNARLPERNKINAIASVRMADGEALVFAHQNGITVYRAGNFSSYGPAEGMAGRAALALLPLPQKLLIGTDSGLTVVDLSEPGAFDRVRSWTRLYPDDWNKNRTEKFLGKRVVALAFHGSRVFMVTDAELIVFSPQDLVSPKEWQRHELPEGEPIALLSADFLYLGTKEGLFRLVEGKWERIPGVPGPIYALLLRGDELLVANDEGIRVLRGGVGSGWVAYGTPVKALAFWKDFVWYVTEDGVYREGELVVPGEFTALGVGLDALWAGARADTDYRLELWRLDPDRARFSQTQTKIDGRDLGKFVDPPAEAHTRAGPSASLSLRRKLDTWDFGISLYSQFPGYEEIGSSRRSDAHGLSFSAVYSGDGPFSASLEGRADLSEISTHPALRLSGGLEGAWKGPVSLNFSLRPTLSQARLSLDFGTGLRADGNPSWNLEVSGRLTMPEFFLAGNLSGKLGFQPWPGLSASLSWSRPYRSRGSAGSENVTLEARLTGGTGFAWNVSWQENLSHPLERWEWTSSRTISGELRLPAFSLGAGKAAPRLNAGVSLNPAEERLSGGVAASWEGSGHRLSFALSAEQGLHRASERTDRRISLNVSWSSSAWPKWGPSLRYSRTWKALLHPRYPPQLREDQTLDFRLAFEFAPGNRNEFTLSWVPGRELRITDRLSYKGSFGATNLEATLTLKAGKLTGKARVDAGISLGGQWGLNVEGGVLFGASPFRAAGFLGATLAVNF
jgi:hypothetical protein